MMNTIKPSEINRLLSERVESLCAHLLPNGKRNGKHWEVGSVDGEKGQSCKVYLDGNGYYDFSTSEGGDYIALWQTVKACDFALAIDQCKAWLGIHEPERKKTYKPAVKPKSIRNATSNVLDYLKGRALSEDTINDFKVVEDSQNGKPAIFFPYIVGGELIHYKILGVERQNGKKQIRASQGTEPCLFGWQTIPPELKTIIICEGEIDAMSFYEYGLYALSVPFGGGDGAKQDWIECEYGRMARFEEIYIAMDSDEPGQIAAIEIANRLGVDRCRIVKLPKKDANECLNSGVVLEEITKAIDGSRHLDIDELISPKKYADETLDWMYGDQSQNGFDTPWKKVTADWRPGWHEITIINGVNGHGKSEIANQFAIHAAFDNHTTMIASMELAPKVLNTRLIRMCSSSHKPAMELARKVLDTLHEKIWIAEFGAGLTPKKLLSVMEYAYRRYSVKVFLIDSLMKCGIAEDDYNGQKAFVESLCELKKRWPIHILLVTHSRKGESENRPTGKMDVRGSGAITDLVDNVLICWRNKAREAAVKKLNRNEHLTDDEQKLIDKSPGTMLALEKDRNNGNEQKFGLFYRNHQFIESDSKPNKMYVTATMRAAS